MTIEYDQSIVKKTKDGVVAISNVLEKGERLIDGSTYRDEEVRLRDTANAANAGSPFAQGTMTEHNNPDDPSAALTLDSTLTNTLREGDDENATGEVGEETPSKLAATVTEDGNSTKVVPTEGNDAPKSAGESAVQDTTVKYVDPPKESDSKQEWYDYATKHKGLTAKYDEITKNEIISHVNEG